MSILIDLQCKVRAQANFLEMLENKQPCFVRNFGIDSKQAKDNLKHIADYKIELIQLERDLESYEITSKGIDIKEPSKLALLVNDYINNIDKLVLKGDIENSRKAVMAYLDANSMSIRLCGDSRVYDMVITHYLDVFENGNINSKVVSVDNKIEVDVIIEQLQYDIKSYYLPFTKAEMLSYIGAIQIDCSIVRGLVTKHFLNIAIKLE